MEENLKKFKSLDTKKIASAISTVFDPEIPVNICDLGLVYGITIYPIGNVHVLITLTSPNCPAAEEIPQNVEKAVLAIPEVNDVKVEITFDPPYDYAMMNDVAKFELGFF